MHQGGRALPGTTLLLGRSMHVPYFNSLVQRTSDNLVSSLVRPVDPVDFGVVCPDT